MSDHLARSLSSFNRSTREQLLEYSYSKIEGMTGTAATSEYSHSLTNRTNMVSNSSDDASGHHSSASLSLGNGISQQTRQQSLVAAAHSPFASIPRGVADKPIVRDATAVLRPSASPTGRSAWSIEEDRVDTAAAMSDSLLRAQKQSS
jgi:hypothetical protein